MQWEDLSRAERWEERPPGFEPPRTSRPPVRPWTILAGIAIAGGALSWLVIASTLLPGAPWLGFGVVVGVFVGVFPVFFTALVAQPGVSRGSRSLFAFIRAMRQIDKRLVTAGGAAFLAAWLCGALTALSGGMPAKGQPEQVGGAYYNVQADTQTPISADRYRSEVAAIERFFASGSAAFYAASAMFLLSARSVAIARRRDQDEAT